MTEATHDQTTAHSVKGKNATRPEGEKPDAPPAPPGVNELSAMAAQSPEENARLKVLIPALCNFAEQGLPVMLERDDVKLVVCALFDRERKISHLRDNLDEWSASEAHRVAQSDIIANLSHEYRDDAARLRTHNEEQRAALERLEEERAEWQRVAESRLGQHQDQKTRADQWRTNFETSDIWRQNYKDALAEERKKFDAFVKLAMDQIFWDRDSLSRDDPGSKRHRANRALAMGIDEHGKRLETEAG